MNRTALRRGQLGREILMIAALLVIWGILWFFGAYIFITNQRISITPLGISQDFMNALVAKDYSKAYDMVNISKQSNFGGSPDGMQQLFRSTGIEPTSFTLTTVRPSSDERMEAFVNGTGIFNGSSKYIYMSLFIQDLPGEGGRWKITGIIVNDNPPTATPAS